MMEKLGATWWQLAETPFQQSQGSKVCIKAANNVGCHVVAVTTTMIAKEKCSSASFYLSLLTAGAGVVAACSTTGHLLPNESNSNNIGGEIETK